MKDISVIAPIKTPLDIERFVKNVKCRKFYVYYHKFLDNNFAYIDEFINVAHANGCELFINFKHDISEENLAEIKKMLKYLKGTKIDGIFINSFAVLEATKLFSLPFKVIIDSYFDIHNLSGIEFVNSFHKISQITVTEEIYLKNISKIKKYTNLSLAIDSDNLPWCAEEIEKTKAIDNVVIKGKFNTSDDILEGIDLVERILEKPKLFKNQKLPFKHVRKSFYQTNHFSGEMVSAEGRDFKFSRNIQKFDWEVKSTRLKSDMNFKKEENYKINLRLSSIDQLKEVKKFIKKIGCNPINSIEYGEIVSTADLATRSYTDIINYVKNFCNKNDIEMQLSTPKILIERDFDRVYEYVKELCLTQPHPTSLIVNNIGYFWAIINDSEMQRISIEIGQGINLLNSLSISCLSNLHPIDSVDFTPIEDEEHLIKTVKKVKNSIKNRKYMIAGNKRVPSLGLCPLNNDSAVVSRLSCKAPCHKGEFALKDPSLKKIFPFAVDGFCRMHMFEDKVYENYDKIDFLNKNGINEFIFDFTALNPKFVQILLTNYFNSRG